MSDTLTYTGWAVLLLFLCSLLCRAGYMVFGDYMPLPEGVRRALRYAPAAALTAIIVPDILPWSAATGPQVDLRLWAALIGILVYMRTRSAVLLIVAGMAALWLMRWALS